MHEEKDVIISCYTTLLKQLLLKYEMKLHNLPLPSQLHFLCPCRGAYAGTVAVIEIHEALLEAVSKVKGNIFHMPLFRKTQP